MRSALNQREYCELHGLPLKRFGNWRAKFKTEPAPPAPKLLYRRGGLSHRLSHTLSHSLSYMANNASGLLELAPRFATNYGMMETMVTTSLPPMTDFDALVNGVGWAFPGVEIKLIKADGAEAPQGEAWVRSEYNLIGYWRNPDASAQSITPDGFFKTGNLADGN